MDKRTILAIALSLAVIIIYQLFFFKPPVKPPTPAPTKEVVKGKEEGPVIAKSLKEKMAVVPQMGEEKPVTVETPLYTAVFTTRGAGLTSFKLKKYKKTLDVHSEPVDLVSLKVGMKAPLGISFTNSSFELPDDIFFTAPQERIELKKGEREARLMFSSTLPGKLKLEKIYTFYPDRYAVDLEMKVANLSPAPIEQVAVVNWYEYLDPKVEKDDYGHTGPVVFVKNEVERPEVKKITGDKLYGPGMTWGGFESKYFLAAVISPNPSLTSMYVEKKATGDEITVRVKGEKVVIPPTQASSISYRLYLGPKEYNLLKAEGVNLEDAIDFGSWLKWLAMPLLITLNFFNQYINNYGISIILLTVLIKILFWPLGNKSYQSMKEMQKLQPKLLELREKYKDDKQRLSQETMALYKAHKINPLGGCLPMIIQIPVFFGLYRALLYAIELRHAPFFGWIKDLSAKDPYYITPIIMGATMFIQQKMTPTGGDPMQQKIMLWMPVVFTFLFLNFPSGLVIYWLFNNIISIGQQIYINKRHG
ncbi:MAG TPA: membrane protein insertase YidC [Syntrophales bacterium]|nr:membrane protein insertase YidC [Syntrophales bacterium]HOL58279.1 membrane protein insertase YidC [Syntrophales bacterium]HPO34448.1 membrane protein insertase YidC [Syntrophales bacterium]